MWPPVGTKLRMDAGTEDALRRFWKDEKAQDLVEYALLLGFVALFSVAFYGSMHTHIGMIWNNVSIIMKAAAA